MKGQASLDVLMSLMAQHLDTTATLALSASPRAFKADLANAYECIDSQETLAWPQLVMARRRTQLGQILIPLYFDGPPALLNNVGSTGFATRSLIRLTLDPSSINPM